MNVPPSDDVKQHTIEREQQSVVEIADDLFGDNMRIEQVFGYAQGTSARTKMLTKDVERIDAALGFVVFSVLAISVGLFIVGRRLKKVENRV